METLELLLRDVRRAQCAVITDFETSALSIATDLLEGCLEITPSVEFRRDVAGLVRTTLELVHDARPTVRLPIVCGYDEATR